MGFGGDQRSAAAAWSIAPLPRTSAVSVQVSVRGAEQRPDRGLRRHAGDRGLRPDERVTGSGCPTSAAGPRTSWRTRLATSTRRRVRPGPVRQRPRGLGRHVVQRRARGHGRMSEIVRTSGLVKRYPGTVAVAGPRPRRRRGRDLRPRRAERRRQDDDAPDPGDAAASRRPAMPRWPASTSAGTPTRRVGSSASCPTSSASTTT